MTCRCSELMQRCMLNRMIQGNMAGVNELTLESIRQFMLERGGKVTNHELVKYFKPFLTNEETKADTRIKFREYVNVLAHMKQEENEKYLVLKPKFCDPDQIVVYQVGPASPSPSSPSPSLSGSLMSVSQESLLDSSSRAPPPYRPPPPPSSSPRYNSPQQAILPTYVTPPPPPTYVIPPTPPAYVTPPTPPAYVTPPNPPAYVTPPPPTKYVAPPPSMLRHVEGQEYDPDQPPPPVPPRRRSSDKGKENILDPNKRPKTEGEEAAVVEKKDVHAVDASEPKISVKERTQKFNRLASESDLKQLAHGTTGKKKIDKGTDDEYNEPHDAKTREWFIMAAKGDYQTLVKLAAERPKLAKFRDPYVTALHWAAKNGNADIVKLLAGHYRVDVNVRTRAGLTALHIAKQFGHDEVYDLLVKTYKADCNVRDYSGRKPLQYQVTKDTEVSADTFRKIKARKKHADKELGFLRIGSLNVRVKKTTEAFSNFLMGSSSTERLHKSWGSADNIQEMDRRSMPPPKVTGSRRRRARRSPSAIQLKSVSSVPLITVPMSALAAAGITTSEEHSQSTPSTPHQARAHSTAHGQDSDSDTACGFDDNWKKTV